MNKVSKVKRHLEIGGGIMFISEFQTKDVVNVSDGKKMGMIGDFDINVTTGKVQAIIINGQGKMLGFFGKDEEFVIPWRNIVKIGKDVILVRINRQNEIQDE
jgi:YlmC/YmxH family sporulation protein